MTQPLFHSDGVGRSGAMCALLVSINRFKTENTVDVFQTIQIMRGQRPGIVGNVVSSFNISVSQTFNISIEVMLLEVHKHDMLFLKKL